MSQVYAPTRRGRITMFREARANALARGDVGMVRAMNAELAQLGVQGDELETVVSAPLEMAVPKAKRGRRPKPRCEHDMILDRCPDCNEEMVA